MEVADFQNLLDRLGDDLSSWPDQARHDAEALLQSSAPARSALAEARAVRALLAPQPVKAPSGLIDRIMQKVRDSGGEADSAVVPQASRVRDTDRSKS